MYKLNNGVEIPKIGFGVFGLGDATKACVERALSLGYRLIDTAADYGNEAETGRAVRNSPIPRSEIFVTTKLWNDDMRKGRQRQAFEESLGRLGMDYVDLYLIHWPVAGKYVESWHVLEELYEEGLVRAIGVCNFNQEQLEILGKEARILPAVNQIEIHPRCAALSIRKFCREHSILCEGWSPLGRGRFPGECLEKIGRRHGKSGAQTAIRWQVQQGLVPLPRSSSPVRIAENFSVFDFELSAEEMEEIDGLNREEHLGATPEHFTF